MHDLWRIYVWLPITLVRQSSALRKNKGGLGQARLVQALVKLFSGFEKWNEFLLT